MAYYQNTIDELTTLLLRNEMAYNSTIVIGDNSSGKSELLKRLLRKADSQKWYLVDSVNRYFDVSQVFYPAKGAPGMLSWNLWKIPLRQTENTADIKTDILII